MISMVNVDTIDLFAYIHFTFYSLDALVFVLVIQFK